MTHERFVCAVSPHWSSGSTETLRILQRCSPRYSGSITFKSAFATWHFDAQYTIRFYLDFDSFFSTPYSSVVRQHEDRDMWKFVSCSLTGIRIEHRHGHPLSIFSSRLYSLHTLSFLFSFCGLSDTWQDVRLPCTSSCKFLPLNFVSTSSGARGFLLFEFHECIWKRLTVPWSSLCFLSLTSVFPHFLWGSLEETFFGRIG